MKACGNYCGAAAADHLAGILQRQDSKTRAAPDYLALLHGIALNLDCGKQTTVGSSISKGADCMAHPSYLRDFSGGRYIGAMSSLFLDGRYSVALRPTLLGGRNCGPMSLPF